MSKRFVIADMHLGHENIIKYENRPFKDLADMHRCIIHFWNSVVNKEDMVFDLGDSSFQDLVKTKEIISALNGHKLLVRGNHDTRSDRWYLDAGYCKVIKYPIIVDEFLILSHAPVYLNEAMPYLNIHGHLHNKTMSLNTTPNPYINVCVEQINYTPVDLDTLKKKYDIGKED